MMFRSIRVKLTLWYICILALILAVFSVITYSIFVRVLQDETNANMTEMATNFNTAVKAEQNDALKKLSPDGLIKEALDEFHFRDYNFVVFSHDNKTVANTGLRELPSEFVAAVSPNKFRTITINDEPFSVLEVPVRVESRSYKLYVLFSLADQIAVETRVQRIFFIVSPFLLLFAGVGGYFLARKSLSPIASMGKQAKRITAANLHERLPVSNPNDEVGELTAVFNQLLDRLDQDFEKQRRFMADASHELRTPLAIVRGESEVALQKDRRTVSEYRESLKIVNDEGKRLTKIVEDLFTLARADSGQIKANLREIYLDEIVADCVKSIRTLADKRNIALQFIGEEMTMRGDESLLRRLFINLLDNAVKYNQDNGRIEVTASNDEIRILNTGPEIPADQKEMIFERFHRVDKTSSRLSESYTSGAGLGLSIAKWIADLHQADLKYSRSENGENIFSLNFSR